jgi:hypothetical protein
MERAITEIPADEKPQGFVDYVAAYPGEVARRIIVNLHLMDKYTLPSLLHSSGIALVLLGFLRLKFRRLPANPEWFLPFSLLPVAGFLFFMVDSRYFVALIPILSIIAGVGLERLGPQEDSIHPRRLSAVAILVLALVLLSFVPWIIRPWFREDPAALDKVAGEWLRKTVGPGVVFLGRSPVIAYYAAGKSIPFSSQSYDVALAKARQAGATFLIADSDRLAATRPDLLDLASGSSCRPGIALTHTARDRTDRRMVIYRITE